MRIPRLVRGASRSTLAVLAASLMAIAIGLPAHAEPPPLPTPGGSVSGTLPLQPLPPEVLSLLITPEQKQGIPTAARFRSTQGPITQQGDITIIYCTWYEDTVEYVNILNQNLWEYRMYVSWCYNQEMTQIVSIDPPLIEGQGHLGWQYSGVQEQNQVDYYGNGTAWLTTSKGKFTYCPLNLCISPSVRYPWINIASYANGQGAADKGVS